MELMIRVYEMVEENTFRMSNEVFIVNVEAKNITEKLKDKIVKVIKNEGFYVEKRSISKHSIVEEYEIYDSGALGYSVRNGGGIAQEYKFINIK